LRLSIVLAGSVLLLATASGFCQSDNLPSSRNASFVAATRSFELHSHPTINLHDFLLWNASGEQRIDPRPACVSSLSVERREALERAQRHYDQRFASPSPESERLLLGLRFALAGFSEVSIVASDAIETVLAYLSPAVPAYLACWWPEHDARNRAWIARLVPRLIAHEDTLRARLAELYAGEWRGRIPVDVVGYAGFGGASTVLAPDHIWVSSAAGANQNDAALEIVFHEASHTLLGIRHGAVSAALQQAAAAADRPLPRDLWHVVLFFTTGRVVQARLLESGVTGYGPYVYAQGLFDRVWPQFRVPLEQHWQPYLDGQIALPEAATRLVSDLASAE
jgi:hypothetical protein